MGGGARGRRAARGGGRALPLAVIGGALFAILPGVEFAPYAAAEMGADVAQAQEILTPYFLPVLLNGGVFFAIGTMASRGPSAPAE